MCSVVLQTHGRGVQLIRVRKWIAKNIKPRHHIGIARTTKQATMAADLITLPKDVDVNKITLAAPKNLDNGGKMVYLYHKTKPFIIQTPVMYAPYGVSKWANDKGGPDKYNLDLSFGSDNKDKPVSKDVADFMELIKRFDDVMIDFGVNNSQAWFKKNLKTRDVVEALYTPLVKYAKDKETGEVTDKYPPTMRFQLPLNRDGKIACEVYNKNCEKVPFDGIDTKRALVSAIVQCNGIWVAGGKFGCTFKIMQMKVVPNANVKVVPNANGLRALPVGVCLFVEDPDDVDA